MDYKPAAETMKKALDMCEVNYIFDPLYDGYRFIFDDYSDVVIHSFSHGSEKFKWESYRMPQDKGDITGYLSIGDVLIRLSDNGLVKNTKEMTEWLKRDTEYMTDEILNLESQIDNLKEKTEAYKAKIQKEHPIKTRQQALLEVFPNSDWTVNGVFELCPTRFDTNFKCNRARSCLECQKAYWLSEYEEPKKEE